MFGLQLTTLSLHTPILGRAVGSTAYSAVLVMFGPRGGLTTDGA